MHHGTTQLYHGLLRVYGFTPSGSFMYSLRLRPWEYMKLPSGYKNPYTLEAHGTTITRFSLAQSSSFYYAREHLLLCLSRVLIAHVQGLGALGTGVISN